MSRGRLGVLFVIGLLVTTTLTPLAAHTTGAQDASPEASPVAVAPTADLFAYDASAPLNLTTVATLGTPERDGITIQDVTFAAPSRTVSAYLVLPPGEGPFAGIVFFHWLEPRAPDGNRSEYLDQAISLAKQGTVSVLVQGAFPWTEAPQDAAADHRHVVDEALVVRRAADLLLSRGDVDPARLAVVGHDDGAMYGTIAAAVDKRFKTVVLMAATPRHADWNLPFWLIPAGLDETGQEAYRQAMADVDPIAYAQYLAPAAVLFQFGREDFYISQPTAIEYYLAASDPKRIEFYDADHPLNIQARVDREAWLVEQLGLHSS
jgi:dienelactone hydrolase